MARTYRATAGIRVRNRLATWLIGVGLGAGRWRILEVRGRTSGRVYRTPISILTFEGRDWLVSPYGRRGWAANAIALGEVTLRRRGRSVTYRVLEVEPLLAAPLLRAYLLQEPITRPYFDVTLESSDAAIAAEAPLHPVFALEPVA